MATSDAPLSIDRVVLTVRDLDTVGDFYERVIGLDTIAGDGESRILGQGDLPLIELRRDAQARSLPFEAGLFHTAFLVPHRDDLGRWLRHYGEAGGRLDGASDHVVSEAVYLQDPEGNGIEIYADRPRSAWRWNGQMVAMDTRPLDIQSLIQAPGRWAGAPQGTVIGHVHLQVGDVGDAETFYGGALGFDLSATLPAARFFATGGYHHHIGTNVWNSRGAGRRSPDAAGLAELVLAATPDEAARLGAKTRADPSFIAPSFTDPWGNRITIQPRPAQAAAA
ncbi:VOC family protein [Afifella marina]|uniref:Catechol 2,3-dioxygenase n=1 Tax=Afifella marina DSM 2698 TaxID=1120955 RepID=A0A1G5MFB1_AFIMA|nr:VOC family protein [Afifella marina]MBK1625537.1 glyoxalase [Afifella marina DSM 2698]MBK1629137.1 glyoxalase [Afifella marina]RAI17295.1 glyoxalase [Afifella marina DSM 2698]SCZ23534.1 catechol 2,3-dioxygenase [Afifella marina DSM 2698]